MYCLSHQKKKSNLGSSASAANAKAASSATDITIATCRDPTSCLSSASQSAGISTAGSVLESQQLPVEKIAPSQKVAKEFCYNAAVQKTSGHGVLSTSAVNTSHGASPGVTQAVDINSQPSKTLTSSETEKILYPKVIRISIGSSEMKKKSEGVLASTPPAISDCGEPTESVSTRRPLIPVSAPDNPNSQIPAAPALTSTANCTTAMTSAVKDSTTPSGKRWALKMVPPAGTARVTLKRGRPRKKPGEEDEEAASAAPEVKMPRVGSHPNNDELCPHCSLGKKSQGCGSGCAWIRIIFPLSFVPVFGPGMGKNQDPGSGINIPDRQHCCRT